MQITEITELEIVTVSWEPCPEFLDDAQAADGRCAGCGWAPEDHDSELVPAA